MDPVTGHRSGGSRSIVETALQVSPVADLGPENYYWENSFAASDNIKYSSFLHQVPPNVFASFATFPTDAPQHDLVDEVQDIEAPYPLNLCQFRAGPDWACPNRDYGGLSNSPLSDACLYEHTDVDDGYSSGDQLGDNTPGGAPFATPSNIQDWGGFYKSSRFTSSVAPFLSSTTTNGRSTPSSQSSVGLDSVFDSQSREDSMISFTPGTTGGVTTPICHDSGLEQTSSFLTPNCPPQSQKRPKDKLKFPCPENLCMYSSATSKDLQRHVTSKHAQPGTPKYQCQCPYEQVRKDLFIRHVKEHCKRDKCFRDFYCCCCQNHFCILFSEEFLDHVKECGKKSAGRPRKETASRSSRV